MREEEMRELVDRLRNERNVLKKALKNQINHQPSSPSTNSSSPIRRVTVDDILDEEEEEDQMMVENNINNHQINHLSNHNEEEEDQMIRLSSFISSSKSSSQITNPIQPVVGCLDHPSLSSSSSSSSSPTISSHFRSRLLTFYEKYNPSKISTINSTLSKFHGREVC